MKLRFLGARAHSSVLRDVRLPEMDAVRFSAENLSDLLALSRRQYVHPTSKIFPTLDAFAVLPHVLFDASKTGAGADCLAFFQVTVSPTHKVNGAVLSRVKDKVCALLGVIDIPLVLVFVTDVNGIGTAKTILQGDGTAYAESSAFPKNVAQVALHLGSDFDKLAGFYKEKIDAEL